MKWRLAPAVLGVLGFLLATQAALAQPPACTVRFELIPRGTLKEGLQGKLILRRDEGEGEPLTLGARTGAPASASLPCSSTWEVTADFPDVWGPRAMVTAKADAPQVSRIALWPLGRIAGTVKLAEKNAKLPKTISVTTIAPRSPNPPPDLPKGRLDCPVKDGRWECSLPAATFDLVLSLEGFIPQYRWDFQVPAGKMADLGVMEWKRGASVAGWVAVEDGALDAGSCRARLTPLLGPGSGTRTAEKIQNTTVAARVGKNGFFQFVGVSPGNYSLEVKQPGFAPGKVHPIEVWPKAESFLREPVVLKRPIQLEIAISPAADWLGDPLQTQVFRARDTGSGSEAVYDGPTNAQGLVTIAGQAPGRFSVEVSDKLGNRLASREIRISGPADAHQTIEVEVLTVYGTVKLGQEPVAATLWFGGRFGSQRVKMESDPEGNFHGILPRDGWWVVAIDSEEPRLNARTKVKVTADRQKRAEVDIVLPATHLFGRVLDDQGRPVRSADVSLSTDEEALKAETDDGGNFEFRGLSEGLAQAAARRSSIQGKWTSDIATVFIREGADVGPIELRLRKTKRVSGRVQSSLGPVPGAGVVVLPLPPTPMFGDSIRTELDGSFAAQVPETTGNVAVIVSPPGFALKAFPLSVSESSQDLMVTREGGSLEVSFSPKAEDVEKEGFSLWVFQDGLPISPDELYRWAAGHGKDHVIEGGKGILVPELAPGQYRACLAARAVQAQWWASGWTAPLAKCAAGQLTAGGRLRLDLSED